MCEVICHVRSGMYKGLPQIFKTMRIKWMTIFKKPTHMEKGKTPYTLLPKTSSIITPSFCPFQAPRKGTKTTIQKLWNCTVLFELSVKWRSETGWNKGFTMYALFWFPFQKIIHAQGYKNANRKALLVKKDKGIIFHPFVSILMNESKEMVRHLRLTMQDRRPSTALNLSRGLQATLCSLELYIKEAWLAACWRQLLHRLWGWQVMKTKGIE